MGMDQTEATKTAGTRTNTAQIGDKKLMSIANQHMLDHAQAVDEHPHLTITLTR
jgi:hypothetical protein